MREAAEAASRVGKPDEIRALADQFCIDEKTGDFDEMADIDALKAEGRLSEGDAAELEEAAGALDVARAYGDALKAAGGCLL